MTETELWEWMMDGNYPPGYPDMDQPELCKLNRRAFATLSRDVQYKETVTQKPQPVRKGFRQPSNNKTKANQWWKKGRRGPAVGREVEVIKTLEKGSRVNVVMASRMGDVGITPNLEAEHGYVVRINCIEDDWDMFGDGKQIIPLKPEGILVDIEAVEDSRTDKVKLAFPK